jgi:replicative DNA helicase
MTAAPNVSAIEPLPIFEGDPIPLLGTHPIPAFPVDAFPDVVADMVTATAEATQTDPAMAGTTALTVVAAAVGGRVKIEVRAGWQEGLNLYTSTVAGPGERKSAVQAELTRPLRDQEAVMAATGAEQRSEAETQHQIAVKAADQAKAAASRATGTEKDRLLAEAVAAGLLADAFKVPAVPRILADDVTGEAAASLLAEQDGRLAVISAEGGIFDVIAGRYSNNIPAMDVWLKGHAGDPLRVDRKGRPPEYIPHPALTVGLMIQPDVLATIGRNGTFRGRGLLARFLYALPTSMVGRRSADAASVPDEVTAAYGTLITKLAADFHGWTDPAILRLNSDATAGVRALLETVEPQLAGTGQLAGLADWGAKFVGAIMRIAGLLHVAEHGEPGYRLPITLDTLIRAQRIGTYFKHCAIAAFEQMRLDPAVQDALYLLDVIPRVSTESTESTERLHDRDSVHSGNSVDTLTVSRRDLHRASGRRFQRADDLDEPIAVLIEHGYLAPTPPTETKGPGRKPSPRWYVHPSVTGSSR